MTPSPDPVQSEIIAHYDRYDESARLTRDIGPFELARTRELIQCWMPPSPAVIVDVGGGTGVYSFWLAELGYEVTLIDIVPRHIEQARQHSRESAAAPLAGMAVGDARCLDFPANSASVVIMHGPLYHLSDRADRLAAIHEAFRILRPGGLLLAFGITRYAGLIYGLLNNHVFDPQYHRMILQEVSTGLRQDPPDWLFTFPNAYFHLPDELKGEVQECGFTHVASQGVIGPAWMVPDLSISWSDPAKREALLAIARATENEPVLGPRILEVCQKPE